MKTGGRWFQEVEFYLESANNNKKKKTLRKGAKTWTQQIGTEWLIYYRLTIKICELISRPHCSSSFTLSGCVLIFFRSCLTEVVYCSALTVMCIVRSYNTRETWHVTQLKKWGQPQGEHDLPLSLMMVLFITKQGTLPTYYALVLILCFM